MTRALAALLLLGAAGCGGGANASGVGRLCSDASACESGLACVVFSGIDARGHCEASVKACSRACDTDPDCAGLGPGLVCIPGCGDNASYCGKDTRTGST